MNNSTLFTNLKETANTLKENIEATKPTKRNLWYVDVDLRKKYGLSFTEAGFLCMINQLQCVNDGFCRAKNYYFIDDLAISDKWIERAIAKLTALNLIWVHIYHTKNGKRRQIVTAESVRLYQQFLKRHKSWATLKKFQEEFAIISANSQAPLPPTSTPPTDPQVPEPIPTAIPSHRPMDKMSIDPSDKMSIAINTTYLPNKKNDVTCQGADAPPAAASSSELRKELQESFPAPEVEIGLRWYENQNANKKARMKKPIACIVKALKDGYAHKEVSAQNAEVASHREKHLSTERSRQLKHQATQGNQRLAEHVVDKFSGKPGWKHLLDAEGLSVSNSSLQSSRDPESGAKITVMPDGSTMHGHVGIRANFDLSSKEFATIVNEFFKKNLWKDSDGSALDAERRESHAGV